MLMESTPSLVNWHSFNKLKRPGILRASSIQTIGCGSDTVQYFQWRKGRSAAEQFHGAVVDHLGRDDTRVFKEVSEVGEILKKLAPVTGSKVTSKAAVLLIGATAGRLRTCRAWRVILKIMRRKYANFTIFI